MITFEVNDMTCGHCVSTITKALKAEDSNAKVQVDLSSHRVTIEPASASSEELRDAIAQAGYTPVVVEPTASALASVARKGCCCS